MSNFEVGDLIVRPGQVGRGALTTAFLPDSTPVNVPLIVVHGAQDGPVLWLSAAMHGPEITGVEVIRRLTREILKPEELRGTVVAVPVMNPFALQHHQMNAPQDGYNLNRVFPGQADGLLTHRIAERIFNEGAVRADKLIDFHANPQPAIMFTVVHDQGYDVGPEALKMAEAFGLTNIRIRLKNEPHRGGMLPGAAHELGKPSITIELLTWRRILEHSVDAGILGTLNVMRQMEMVDGPIEPQTVTRVDGDLSRVEITANRGGFVHMACSEGQAVRKGERVASILDPFGDTQEEIASPVDGWILAYPLINSQCVATGDLVAFIAYEL